MTVCDLRDEMTPTTKANEILMQAMVDERFYLLVEGATDFKLFNRILPVEAWEVEFLDGKHNVAKCMQDLVLQGANRVSAVLDSDPLDPCISEGQVFYSQLADLDADLFAIEGLIDRIVTSNAQVRDQTVLAQIGQPTWRDVVIGLVEPWTAARLHLSVSAPGVSMKEFPVHLLGDAQTAKLRSVELNRLVENKGGRGYLESVDVKDLVHEKGSKELELFHNGHHIASALAWVLSEVLKANKLRANTVEDFARTAITLEEIRRLRVVVEFHAWAHAQSTCIWPAGSCDQLTG
ncbi:hypothetical protein [Pseudarthrobacter sp. Y6]|uniref:hypothetical protein n=1 Tax=Pseudarthrobacter sp. Y6 TaxID=3418422 RepID=UPI003CF85E34